MAGPDRGAKRRREVVEPHTLSRRREVPSHRGRHKTPTGRSDSRNLTRGDPWPPDSPSGHRLAYALPSRSSLGGVRGRCIGDVGRVRGGATIRVSRWIEEVSLSPGQASGLDGDQEGSGTARQIAASTPHPSHRDAGLILDRFTRCCQVPGRDRGASWCRRPCSGPCHPGQAGQWPPSGTGDRRRDGRPEAAPSLLSPHPRHGSRRSRPARSRDHWPASAR